MKFFAFLFLFSSSAVSASEEPFTYIYETYWYEKAFSDAGSGARMDLNVWAPVEGDGRISLGCVATGSTAKPAMMLMATGGEEGVDYKNPTSWTFKWKDEGSKANVDFSFWNPVCSDGFVPLSGWAKKGWSEPSLSVMKCVKRSYAQQSTILLDPIWTDSYSGAKHDASVWPIENNPNAWMASGYSRPSDTVYSPPVIKFAEIEPDIDQLTLFVTTPKHLKTLYANNYLDDPGQVTKSLTESVTDTYSFTQTDGFSLELSTSVTYKIPFVSEVETSLSSAYTSTWEEAQEHSETYEVGDTITCPIPANSRLEFSLMVWEGNGDIPFYGTVYFEDDTEGEISGVWSGVDYGVVEVTCKDLPLPPEELAEGRRILRSLPNGVLNKKVDKKLKDEI